MFVPLFNYYLILQDIILHYRTPLVGRDNGLQIIQHLEAVVISNKEFSLIHFDTVNNFGIAHLLKQLLDIVECHSVHPLKHDFNLILMDLSVDV